MNPEMCGELKSRLTIGRFDSIEIGVLSINCSCEQHGLIEGHQRGVG